MKHEFSKGAYITALILLAALLIFLGLTQTGSFEGTWVSLLPPVVAICFALISKEVYSSLFIGCFVGALLYTNFHPWNALVAFIGGEYGILSVLSDGYNMGIIAFLVMLGVIVVLMNRTGGSEAFGRWAMKHVKTRAGAQIMSMILGTVIFIDDYFNCLTVGAVMRPVTESHKISRAKLAYIIDATAAPVCMIAPVSSWAAAVSGYVNSDSVDGFTMFIKQIPFNFYCVLTLVMMVVISLLNIDYGPMLKHEYNAQVHNDLFTTPERPFEGDDDYETGSHTKSSVWDLVIPVIVLIIACVVGMIYAGNFFDPAAEEYLDFVMAFANTDASVGLSIGSLIGMIFTFVYFWLRKSIGFNKSFEAVPEGFTQMVSPILILTLAWTLCSFTRYALDSETFVKTALAGAESFKNFLPAIIFLIGCFIGFATGTSWGTIGIMAPIVCSAFDFASEPTLCCIGLAAACAGGVAGDHSSPISDTTIMASAGAHCYHLNHVFTQIPYAVTVAAVSFICFIIAGFVQNWIICLPISFVLMICTLLVIGKITKNKHADMYKEMAAARAEN